MCWLRVALRPYEASPFPRPHGLTDKREGRFAILIILDGRRDMPEREIRVLQERVALPGRPTRSELRRMSFEKQRRAALQALEELFRRASK